MVIGFKQKRCKSAGVNYVVARMRTKFGDRAFSVVGLHSSLWRGRVREFCNSGKLRDNSGNLKCIWNVLREFFYHLPFFHDAICNKQHTVIYSLLPLNGYSGTTAGSGPLDSGGCNNFMFWNIMFRSCGRTPAILSAFLKVTRLFYNDILSSTDTISVSLVFAL